MKLMVPQPVCVRKCKTCPFRHNSPHAYLREHLEQSAMSEASRECHSTGTNAIGGRTGKKPLLCRGARDLQLKMFYAMRFISAPTDAAWLAKVNEMNAARLAAAHG